MKITTEMLPNWDEDLWVSDYNGIQVVKDLNIKDGFKVYIHNMPDDGHCVKIGVFTYVYQLKRLAKAIGVEYPIKNIGNNKRVKDAENNKKFTYYWDEYGNKIYYK